ncbi:hypothetical protein ERN12_13990 [Rhodobacteraceae bacterium]|nr:hypothetical protein ERN12_13990 [Paracoccaceae bacterium]
MFGDAAVRFGQAGDTSFWKRALMFGLLLTPLAALSSRLFGLAFVLAIWLFSRPGGWAVLAMGALVAVKLLPVPTP